MINQPSPYADRLDRLTTQALNAFNHAFELEIIEGWTWRTRAAYREYRKALLRLGRATQDALYARSWQDERREMHTKARKAS